MELYCSQNGKKKKKIVLCGSSMWPLLLSPSKYRYVTGGVNVFFAQINKHFKFGCVFMIFVFVHLQRKV